MKKTLIASLIFGAFFLSISSSQAGSLPLGSTLCAETDVSANGKYATDCKGSYYGNDSVSTINDLFKAELGPLGTWELAAKVSIDPDSEDFNLIADSGAAGTSVDGVPGKVGNWEYTGTTPLSAPFVVVLKASTEFSAYLFTDLNDLVMGDTGGFFIGFLNNGTQFPDLSHMSIYSKTNTSAVPLPAALWLFGPALLGFMGFRKKNQS